MGGGRSFVFLTRFVMAPLILQDRGIGNTKEWKFALASGT